MLTPSPDTRPTPDEVTSAVPVTDFDRLLDTAFALHQQGDAATAQRHYEQVLAQQPAQVRALHLLGMARLQQDDPADAATRFEQALAQQPDHADSHLYRGVALRRLGRLDAALACYDRALLLRPDHADTSYNRGNLLVELRLFETALASYDLALRHRPDHADTLANRAQVLHELKLDAAAIESLDRSLALRPDHVPTRLLRAGLLLEAKRATEALTDYDLLLAAEPGHVAACVNRGNALSALGHFDESRAAYERVLAADPDHFEAAFNLGNTLMRLHALDEALVLYHRLLERHPDHPDVLMNLSCVQRQLRQPEAALAVIARSLELDPDDASAHLNRSLCLLQLGDFHQGWREYEWRWKDHRNTAFRAPAHAEAPLWLGDTDLAGRTLLLHAEQGLGDTLQFCRYVPLAKALGARVVLEVQPVLRSLIQGLPGIDALHVRGDELPPFDLQCPLLSLPLAFGTGLDSIPTPHAYLQADADRLDAWRQRLGPAPRPRVGLVWSGNPEHDNDRNRSLPLATLLPHLQPLLADIDFHLLQKEIRPADQTLLDTALPIHRWCDELQDFSDTAALCGLMDLVISVDTSVAHLAGALGRPLWLLLPFNPDWRWLLERDDSPWYASARLWRQSTSGDWDGLLAQLGPALRAHLLPPPDATTDPDPV